jgi:hypothetical protein
MFQWLEGVLVCQFKQKVRSDMNIYTQCKKNIVLVRAISTCHNNFTENAYAKKKNKKKIAT